MQLNSSKPSQRCHAGSRDHFDQLASPSMPGLQRDYSAARTGDRIPETIQVYLVWSHPRIANIQVKLVTLSLSLPSSSH